MALVSKRLEGKVAIITGGSSGLGKATVRLFLRHGATVVFADIQDDLGQTICQELGSEETLTFIHCDVTKETDVKNVIQTTIAKHNKLDIIYNAAGISGEFGLNLMESTSEEFKKVFETNVFGSFLFAKHAAKVMISAKKGTIIFTGSIASVTCGNIAHAYTMSKHAVLGMLKSMATELGQYGIRVNCVSPYVVATPMVKKVMNTDDESKVEELFSAAAILKGVVLKAEDVAEAVLYLASDEAKYVSGLNLVIDGAFSVTNPTFPVEVKPVSEDDTVV